MKVHEIYRVYEKSTANIRLLKGWGVEENSSSSDLILLASGKDSSSK